MHRIALLEIVTFPIRCGKVAQCISDVQFRDVQFFIPPEGDCCSQKSITDGNKAYGTPDIIIEQAEAFYMMLLQSDEGWTGVKQASNPSAFIADGKRPCFNCGAMDCSLAKCPKPKNEDRIKANKKKFFDTVRKHKKNSGGRKNKDKNGGGGGSDGKNKNKSKWAPLKNGEKNRKLIDGVEYWCQYKTKKWIKSDRVLSAEEEMPTDPADAETVKQANLATMSRLDVAN